MESDDVTDTEQMLIDAAKKVRANAQHRIPATTSVRHLLMKPVPSTPDAMLKTRRTRRVAVRKQTRSARWWRPAENAS